MNNYDYCQFSSSEEYLWFNSTNPNLSLEIFNEVKKYYPTTKIETKHTLATGEDYGFTLKGFTSQHGQNAVWLIIKYLCTKSWEPLGTSNNSHNLRKLSTS